MMEKTSSGRKLRCELPPIARFLGAGSGLGESEGLRGRFFNGVLEAVVGGLELGAFATVLDALVAFEADRLDVLVDFEADRLSVQVAFEADTWKAVG